MENNHVPTLFFATIRYGGGYFEEGTKAADMDSRTEIVYKHLDEHISVRTLEKEYQADRSMICRWVKKYLVEGEISFEHKGHPGNPFSALHTSKTLSEAERLRLMVAKLEIENERLKKDT